MGNEHKQNARRADYVSNRNHDVGSEAWLTDEEYAARQRDRDPEWLKRHEEIIQERKQKATSKNTEVSDYARAKGK